MKRKALGRAGIYLAFTFAAGAAWALPQPASGIMRREAVPQESLSAPSQRSGVSDTIITARAKAALLRADRVDSGNVHVTTTGGHHQFTWRTDHG
ncbi:hypothetical protein [Paraburkholderia sacchari]|uniref:hypothetical protein n=1 Tax=Paraburkholderia sacchari TaxID=159450 RepID=UPI001BCD6624|nr:hypothetical protein [Paraburkholderia sacchari]